MDVPEVVNSPEPADFSGTVDRRAALFAAMSVLLIFAVRSDQDHGSAGI
jgi:hypothetical protein